MKYEGNVGLGQIIIAPLNHENIKLTLKLKNPIKITEYRKVRKFLELSTFDSSIVSDSAFIYGLGELRGNYNPKEESIFQIKFTSHYKWSVFHDSNELLVVEYKEPYLSKPRVQRKEFETILTGKFQSITQDQQANLWDLTTAATKQRHGTMIVVSQNAIEESQRLGKQCFPINPIQTTKEMVLQISSIDGAMLFDIDGNCHAIGVILDGLATEKGDSSRGARYNSAVRYLEHFGETIPTVLIIISEDGMINIM